MWCLLSVRRLLHLRVVLLLLLLLLLLLAVEREWVRVFHRVWRKVMMVVCPSIPGNNHLAL